MSEISVLSLGAEPPCAPFSPPHPRSFTCCCSHVCLKGGTSLPLASPHRLNDHCSNTEHPIKLTNLSCTTVRLVAGSNVSSEGRVEMFYNGTWKSVCSHYRYSWDLKEANVVCRQLGFPGAVTASSAWEFGRKQEGLWLSSPWCVGNEASLTECYHRGWAGSCYYGHVGVVCAAGNKKIP